MLSSSTKYDPSARCSATVVTAFTAMSARSSLWPLADLDDIEVIPTFFRVSSSLMEIFVATFSRTSWALSEAWRYPAAITVGWMFWSIRSSAFLSSSPAKMTAVVVPSPASSSWVFATSTSIFGAGCSMPISWGIVTPSFVMTTSPRESTSILSIPRGPRVLRTASATAFAAAMLLNWAPFPFSRRVPSFSTKICVPAGIIKRLLRRLSRAELSKDFYISMSPASGGFFSRASPRPSVKAILEGVADAIQAAVHRFKGDLGEVVGRGATGANTQRIDLVAEQAAFAYLKDRGRPYTVVSEEAGRVEGEGDWTLVLDPVDGTHNAVRGFPAYAVSIAAVPRAPRGNVERLRDVTAGLVRDLVTGHTYFAGAGKGAFLNDRPIQVRKPFAP